MTTDNETNQAISNALKLLSQSDDYRVLSRLKEVNHYRAPLDSETVFTGVGLDVETTGFKAGSDQIIELGLVVFRYNDKGQILDIVDSLSEFEDPEVPISAEITAITGITDEDVRGRDIDTNRVINILSKADMVVAHNAAFDRKFIDMRFDLPDNIKWACSLKDIDWDKEKVEGKKLSQLANHYGFFFDAHRAETDVRAMIHLLHFSDNEGTPLLKQLSDKIDKPAYRIWASAAPFDSKDTLKEAGFAWHPGDEYYSKSWHKAVSNIEDLRQVMSDLPLSDAVKNRFTVETFTPSQRYSDQTGSMSRIENYIEEPAFSLS